MCYSAFCPHAYMWFGHWPRAVRWKTGRATTPRLPSKPSRSLKDFRRWIPRPSPPAPLPPVGEGNCSPLPQAGEGLGERVVEIASTAQKLNELRNNWLNPPEWTGWVRTPEEEKAGYPLRPVAKDVGLHPQGVGRGCTGINPQQRTHQSDLQKRTLTNLYNARPAWLDNAQKELDAAVAKACGWNDYTPEMTNEEILRRLLALNLERIVQHD